MTPCSRHRSKRKVANEQSQTRPRSVMQRKQQRYREKTTPVREKKSCVVYLTPEALTCYQEIVDKN